MRSCSTVWRSLTGNSLIIAGRWLNTAELPGGISHKREFRMSFSYEINSTLLDIGRYSPTYYLPTQLFYLSLRYLVDDLLMLGIFSRYVDNPVYNGNFHDIYPGTYYLKKWLHRHDIPH